MFGSKNLYGYEDITLSMFMEISKTGNVRLLAKSCIKTKAECMAQWERIVKNNIDHNGNNEYEISLWGMKNIAMLISDYNVIKASLLKLSFMVDDAALAILNGKGYRIDTTTASGYLSSLSQAFINSDSLLTKIQSKKAELEKLNAKGTGREHTFQEALANISYLLGFGVSENIKLSAYNEYIHILKTKNTKANG